MEYPAFTVNFPVILVSVMVTVVVGVIALVLNSLKKRRLALLLSSATVLLITAFVVASGFLEAARTNEMLRAADVLPFLRCSSSEPCRGGRQGGSFKPQHSFPAWL